MPYLIFFLFFILIHILSIFGISQKSILKNFCLIYNQFTIPNLLVLYIFDYRDDLDIRYFYVWIILSILLELSIKVLLSEEDKPIILKIIIYEITTAIVVFKTSIL